MAPVSHSRIFVSSSQFWVGPVEAGHIPMMLAGEIDLANAQLIVELGTSWLRRDEVTTLALDLDAVTFMDSTALSAMITLLNLAREVGKTLTLIRVPDRIERLLDLTGLSRIFPLESDGSDRP